MIKLLSSQSSYISTPLAGDQIFNTKFLGLGTGDILHIQTINNAIFQVIQVLFYSLVLSIFIIKEY